MRRTDGAGGGPTGGPTGGAPADLAHLLDGYRHELLAHCRRILGSSADADDAVQETMIRAWRGIERFEHRSSLRTWLYRIATNICIDQVRSRARRPLPFDPTGGGGEDDPGPPPLPDTSAGPADTAVTNESVRRAILAAVTHLPPRQRAALVLYDVFRWPATDVAGLLGTTPASVTSAVQRARATLADLPPAPAHADGDEDDDEEEEQRLVDSYAEAFARYDMAALAALEPAC